MSIVLILLSFDAQNLANISSILYGTVLWYDVRTLLSILVFHLQPLDELVWIFDIASCGRLHSIKYTKHWRILLCNHFAVIYFPFTRTERKMRRTCC